VSAMNAIPATATTRTKASGVIVIFMGKMFSQSFGCRRPAD
jgi:hypothetical protein